MFAKQSANKSDATDIFVAVFLTEAEPFGEVRANYVAVEYLDAPAALLEFLRYNFGES